MTNRFSAPSLRCKAFLLEKQIKSSCKKVSQPPQVVLIGFGAVSSHREVIALAKMNTQETFISKGVLQLHLSTNKIVCNLIIESQYCFSLLCCSFLSKPKLSSPHHLLPAGGGPPCSLSLHPRPHLLHPPPFPPPSCHPRTIAHH